MKEKFIITGATGAIGKHVFQYGSKDSIGIARISSGEANIFSHDLATPLPEHFAGEEYTTIFHLAAKTHIDNCENDRTAGEQGDTWRDNVVATQNIIEYCRSASKRLVFVSTECVFDGCKDQPYKESDLTSPKNWYGETKRLAEELVINSGLEYLIVRSVVAYGFGDEHDMVGKIIKLLINGQVVKSVNDQLFNPTFVDDIVDGLFSLQQIRAQGIYHLAGGEILSPYEFTLKIAQRLGVDTNHVEPISLVDFFGYDRAILRLQNATLANTKLTSQTNFYPKTVDEGLDIYFKRHVWR